MSTTTNPIVKTDGSTPQRKRALEVMAERLSVEPAKLLATLKNTCFKGATDDEMLALVVVANEYGLNPLLKELYAFPGKGGGIVPMVPIDGWTKIVNRQDALDGVEFEWTEDGGKPVSCTAILYLKNRTKPLRIQEFFSECYRNTDPWNKMPRRMLRHKAYMQAARLAFGISGIFDEDEAKDAAKIIEIKPAKLPEPAGFLAGPATASEVVQDHPDDAPQSHPEEAAPVTQPPTDGEKTRRMNAICQGQKLELGDALKYLGAMGHASFEDLPLRLVENYEKRPGQFAQEVRGA